MCRPACTNFYVSLISICMGAWLTVTLLWLMQLYSNVTNSKSSGGWMSSDHVKLSVLLLHSVKRIVSAGDEEAAHGFQTKMRVKFVASRYMTTATTMGWISHSPVRHDDWKPTAVLMAAHARSIEHTARASSNAIEYTLSKRALIMAQWTKCICLVSYKGNCDYRSNFTRLVWHILTPSQYVYIHTMNGCRKYR